METPPPTNTTVAFFTFIIPDVLDLLVFFPIFAYTQFFGSLVQCTVV